MIGASTKVHTDRVTCVRWVRPAPSTGSIVISTGADGRAVLWSVSNKETEGLYVLHPLVTLGTVYTVFVYSECMVQFFLFLNKLYRTILLCQYIHSYLKILV